MMMSFYLREKVQRPLSHYFRRQNYSDIKVVICRWKDLMLTLVGLYYNHIMSLSFHEWCDHKQIKAKMFYLPQSPMRRTVTRRTFIYTRVKTFFLEGYDSNINSLIYFQKIFAINVNSSRNETGAFFRQRYSESGRRDLVLHFST